MTEQENQMIDPVAAARREYDNADKAFCLNPTDANLASYEIARKAFLAASPVSVDDDEDQDERPFPDSDEAIRALQDVAESVDELLDEAQRLRAENKLLRAERDEARREVCKSAGILRSVVDPNQEVEEWAKHIAKVNKWDCFKEEETP